jgi:hypothetical protein
MEGCSRPSGRCIFSGNKKAIRRWRVAPDPLVDVFFGITAKSWGENEMKFRFLLKKQPWKIN